MSKELCPSLVVSKAVHAVPAGDRMSISESCARTVKRDVRAVNSAAAKAISAMVR